MVFLNVSGKTEIHKILKRWGNLYNYQNTGKSKFHSTGKA